MIPALKSEFRKLLTIRSTYIILGIAVILELIFAFYIVGWHTTRQELLSSHYLYSQAISAVNILSLLLGLIAVLLVTHEYRYNTIMYTLTAGKNRSTVFLAKFLAISAFSILFTMIFALMSPLLSLAAVHLRGLDIGSQVLPLYSMTWRIILAGWAMTAFAFIMAMLIRVQVGAIAALFLVPSTVEQLLGLILKGNQVYLPFSSVNVLLDAQAGGGSHISYGRAALIVAGYVIVGTVAAWAFFARRDAN